MLRLCWVAAVVLVAGCPSGGAHHTDSGMDATAEGDASDGAMPPDAAVDPCDATGAWIVEEHRPYMGAGSSFFVTHWYFYRITDHGSRFAIDESLNCGFAGDLSSVAPSLSDATLATLVTNEVAGPGGGGSFAPSASGATCELTLDRMYDIRGAKRTTYLTNTWQVGDAAKPLADFVALPTVAPDMEDWDADVYRGITLHTSLGNRYVAQRDWHEHAGTVPQLSTNFGGDGVIVVAWEIQESVSTETTVLLRTSPTPNGNAWARYARIDPALVVATGVNAARDTCLAVQDLAAQTWP